MKSNYINQFFNKDPNDLMISDIKNYFINPQEESSTLEFKSGEVEITDVFKEVAAFLNTEGGLLIIGAPRESKETKGKRTIRYCQGDITFSKFISKDWLNQKLFSNITPSPTEIFIKEINTETGSIFIIDIPQSLNPPHQSNSDGRYYIRIDNEAKPAPHGLIQALFDKRRKPKLFARLNKKKIGLLTDEIEVSLFNDSNVPADKVCFIIDIYNVTGTSGKFVFEKREDTLGPKFYYSGTSSQVLASVISIGCDFCVLHQNENYLISVNYWSKETDFDCTYFLINPFSEIIESYNWLDEGCTLTEKIASLRNKKD